MTSSQRMLITFYSPNRNLMNAQEAIENCQTRVAKMELQHQQRVSVEGLENASARALITKLINLLLSVMAVILVLVSTVSGLLMPFMRSQVGFVCHDYFFSTFNLTFSKA